MFAPRQAVNCPLQPPHHASGIRRPSVAERCAAHPILGQPWRRRLFRVSCRIAACRYQGVNSDTYSRYSAPSPTTVIEALDYQPEFARRSGITWPRWSMTNGSLTAGQKLAVVGHTLRAVEARYGVDPKPSWRCGAWRATTGATSASVRWSPRWPRCPASGRRQTFFAASSSPR